MLIHKYSICITFRELSTKSNLRVKIKKFCKMYKLKYKIIQNKNYKLLTLLKSPHINKRSKENFHLFKLITKLYIKLSLKNLYFLNTFFYNYNKKIIIKNF